MDGSDMILPGTGRGTIRTANGGGGSSLRKPSVYRARKLRREMSLPEVMLWNQLRRQKLGFRVRRQHPIGEYDVDFYIASRRLVIEVDGEVHNRGDRPERDAARDRYMEGRGYSVFRIAATDVIANLDGVIAAIVARADNPLHHPADGPPPRAGEE